MVSAPTCVKAETYHVEGGLQGQVCPICLTQDDEDDDIVELLCPGHHRFHKQCIQQWLSTARDKTKAKRCPLCRGQGHVRQVMTTDVTIKVSGVFTSQPKKSIADAAFGSSHVTPSGIVSSN